jgi:hypothetical protein
MAAINEEAIEDLSVSLQVLLPAPPTGVTTAFSVHPRRITPTGLGGYVGHDPDRTGDITGRRIEATIRVTASGRDHDNLQAAVASVTLAVLGAERQALAALGFLTISQEETVVAPGPGNLETAEMTFSVRYEYLKRPEAAEEVISEIPINLDLG